MSKNDRYMVNHSNGWAVVKPNAERAGSVQGTQREAEKQAKEIVRDLGKRGPHSEPARALGRP